MHHLKLMKSKISLKWAISIIGITGTIFFSIIISLFVLDLFIQDSYAKVILPVSSKISQNEAISNQGAAFREQASSGILARLKIPKIKVDAPIISVGITQNGAMDAPKSPAEAAWFKFGPYPGDNGSAVIAGHFGPWKKGGGSVFDNLNKLKKGDKIYVEDEKGAGTVFVVRELRTYGKNDDGSSVFGSIDGRAHLNLITCEGIWDKVRKTYSNRLVVFADKETQL